jgi:folate-binding protein YgfZ
MQISHFCKLEDRALVRVGGPDAATFLNGLITCEIGELKTGDLTFGALLSPQGKILFDFFILCSTQSFIIDVEKSMADDLIHRLTFYRLRAKVEIAPMDKRTNVYAIWGYDDALSSIEADGVIAPDPRLAAMGWRGYLRRAPKGPIESNMAAWNGLRIARGMPSGGHDFAFGDAFPHEALMDQFGGVDFKKGCFIGQEVVSRMQHRSTARKRFVKAASTSALPDRGSEIMAGGKSCGILTSVDGQSGLALVRIDRVAQALAEGLTLLAGTVGITLAIADWCRFTWPKGE